MQGNTLAEIAAGECAGEARLIGLPSVSFGGFGGQRRIRCDLEAFDPVSAHRRSSSKNSRIVVAVLILETSEEATVSDSPFPRATLVGGCHGEGLGRVPITETVTDAFDDFDALDAVESAALRREATEFETDATDRPPQLFGRDAQDPTTDCPAEPQILLEEEREFAGERGAALDWTEF